jgi:gliding motility-associated-like protein
LNVSYYSDNTAVATIDGGMIHITGAGSANITASQAGDANYNPAPDVIQPLTVNKAAQTITFSPLPAKTYGDADFSPGAASSSGLTVSYSSDNTAVATIAGGMIHITGAGSANITASQSGNTNFNAAADVVQPLVVSKSGQTIIFTAIPDRLLIGDTFTLEAVASSGLTVSFESQNPAFATVAGSLLTGVTKGTATIRAFNNGDQNYNPAETSASVDIVSTHRDIMHLFTPNGDGINDYWELPDLQEWGKCEVKVYNRWGKLVYDNADYDNLWDGTSDGKPVPEGPYYFIIKTENAGIVKGNVNIVR